MVRMIQHSITVKLTDIRDPTAADLGDKLMRCLRARQCPETVHCLQAATILDPRLKILGFGNPDKGFKQSAPTPPSPAPTPPSPDWIQHQRCCSWICICIFNIP